MNHKLPRQKVLIVDDVPTNIRLLGDALRDEYKIIVSVHGPEAVAIARSNEPPDLILLDIVMPDMSGYEVCRQLKSRKETRDIPVIFLTSKDKEADETKGLELGAVDYITKPFSLAIVKRRVKTHLELKMQRDMLRELSMLDPLTRLPNRLRLMDRLDLEWKRALRQAASLCILFIDVDSFKQYNDTHGHAQGDECLRFVARELSCCLRRATDMVARYGGEEFVALLPDTTIEEGRSIAAHICSSIQSLKISHPTKCGEHLTVSIGAAATIPAAGTSHAMLLETADKGLYLAKAQGKNRVEVAPDMAPLQRA